MIAVTVFLSLLNNLSGFTLRQVVEQLSVKHAKHNCYLVNIKILFYERLKALFLCFVSSLIIQEPYE